MTLIKDTWANTQSPIGLELFVDGAWADITQDLSDDGVTIKRGRSDEGNQVDPAEMRFNLRNNDGRYSPRNPRSPLYGLIGRNTPVRFWVEHGQVRLVQDAQTQFYAADSSALSVTGDIDLRVDVAMRTWRPDTTKIMGLIKDASYWLRLETSGQISLCWSEDGSATKTLTSSVPVPGGITGRKAVRATLDVSISGSAQATFYHSDTLSGTWTQFGAVEDLGATTSIYNSTNSLGTYTEDPAEVFGIEVRNGIGGTIVARVDWTTVTSGATSYADAYGNTWTQSDSANVTNRHYRFVGEVTAWPQKWGLKGAPSAYSPVECSGILRRMGQGASPVQSAMRRGCESLGSNLVGYWPMEDQDGAESLAPVVGTQPGRLTGAVDLAANSGFEASAPIPTLSTGSIYCGLTPYANAGEAQIRWLASFPTGGLTADVVMLRVRTNSTLGWVDVHYASGGGWYAKTYTNLGVNSLTTATLDSDLDDKNMRLSLELKQSGSGVEVKLVSIEAGLDSGLAITETNASITLGSITSVEFNPNRVDLGQLAVGHLTIEKGITSIFDLADQFAAYVRERADTRMLRLADENDISLAVIGAGAGVERMGPQSRDELVDLFKEAAVSDGGVMFEPRDEYGLRYRTLESLWSQDPALSIEYDDNLLLPFEPVDDDQATRNRVTVTRSNGGSYTEEITDGPLSTLAPPDGVGVYDESVTMSLGTDASAEQQAGWLAHLGTADEARWPQIGMNLAHPTFKADDETLRKILTLDIGDRLDVTNLPEWLPPFDVRQIVRGYTEQITPNDYQITFNCTPSRPYTVGAYVASGYETATTSAPAVPSTTIVSDDGTGKTDGTALDTAKWTTEGTTAGSGSATYQSTALKFQSGNQGAYAGTSRTSRSFNTSTRTDGEVTGTFTHDANEAYPLVMARATTSGVDFPNGYYLEFNKANTVRIGKLVSFSGTTLATGSVTPASSTTYGFRFRVKGNALKARVWTGSEGTVDPNDAAYPWDIQTTDNTFTSAGKWGITVGAGSAATNHAVTFDNVVFNAADGTSGSTGVITTRTATLVEQSAANSITGTLPSDIQTGDLAVAVYAFTFSGTITGPSGWTSLFTSVATGTGDPVQIAAFYKFNPSGNPTCSTSATATSNRCSAIVQAFGGVDTTNPIDVTAVVTQAANSSSLVATGVTTTVTNARMLAAFAADTNTRTAVIPTGMTSVKATGGSGGGRCLALAAETRASAGATGTRTWSVTPSASVNMNGFITALRPQQVVTTVIPIDAGPSETRFAPNDSSLNSDAAIDATSLSVKTTKGPLWTVDANDFPLDILIDGEQMTITAVSGTSSPQTFTVTRAVNGISKAHSSGADITLLDPSYWGARPTGGSSFSGGSDTGGGGTPPDTSTPNTVRIGSATYPLSGVNPGSVGGWGGDSNYPGYRGVDQLVVYSNPTVTTTATNQWGAECVVTDSTDLVASVNDREATQSLTGTSIASGKYVLSGHSNARQWLLANATVGAGPVELIYVAPSGGGTGGGTGGGGTGGGTIGAWGNYSVCIYHLAYSSSTLSMGSFDSKVTEFRLSFAFDQSGNIKLADNNFAATNGTWNAAIAAKRAAGTKIVISLGGAGNTVTTSNPTTAANQIIAIGTLLGGFDGIDWDIEAGSSFPTANAIAISAALKSHYGDNFGITMAPNGSNVGNYLPAAVQLHQQGLLTWYAQQFYDSPVSLSAAKGRIAEAINAGIPASKIGVGMALTSNVSGGFWSQSTCQTNMQDIRNTYGVRRCYLWEANTPSSSAAVTWASNMYAIVSPN